MWIAYIMSLLLMMVSTILGSLKKASTLSWFSPITKSDCSLLFHRWELGSVGFSILSIWGMLKVICFISLFWAMRISELIVLSPIDACLSIGISIHRVSLSGGRSRSRAELRYLKSSCLLFNWILNSAKCMFSLPLHKTEYSLELPSLSLVSVQVYLLKMYLRWALHVLHRSYNWKVICNGWPNCI